MEITKEIRYIGVNDHGIDLFEGQYPVKNGMAYNSYAILDEKIAVMDTVEVRFGEEWLGKLESALAGRTPDYLIVQHMEPDHSANILRFAERYPAAVVVATARAFELMHQFYGVDFEQRRIVAREGGTLPLGRHTLTFYMAPMVHWPEVMMTWDDAAHTLFSADAFGKFGALDAEEDWTDEARRYYIGIVGKYGTQVQNLLKKVAGLDIRRICPLHGPVLQEELGRYVGLYDTWSSYAPEAEGVTIAYTSVYGHTKQAAELLAEKLRANGCPRVAMWDLARSDMFGAVADAFRYDRLVLATTTYNGDIFPFMRTFISHLAERGFRGRTVGIIENGSWAPAAGRVMRTLLACCRDLTYADASVTVKSALDGDSAAQVEALAAELCRTAEPEAPRAPEPAKKKFVCKLCGYVYEGDALPEGFVCPICGRPASNFEPVN